MSKPIPQPPGLPILGNITAIDPTNVNQSLKILTEKYGEFLKFSILGQDRYIASSARLAKELCDEKRFCKAVNGPLEEVRNGVGDGLFTAHHGEHNWETAHRTLVPAFGPLGIKEIYDEMYDIATQLVAKWARMGPEEPINTADDYTRLTLDSIALCAMGKRFNSFYHDEMHPFVGAMVNFLLECGMRVQRTRLERLINPTPGRLYEQNIATMKSVAKEVIEYRRANPSDKKDLLNAMLFGKDPKTGERLTEESIINNMITFLIAGHETTSGLLSFTSYYLLKNPDAMQKAREEVDKVVGKGPVKYEHMSKLPYLEACFRESLRLSPTAPAFTVRPIPGTKEPVLLGGDYLLPPEANVTIWLPTLGKDPDVYGADADEFKPERMYGENFSKTPFYAWKPFGNGARACIGRPFAWQEALLSLALILQNFHLRMDDPSYQLKIKQTLTIKPDEFRIRATLREGIDPVTLERKLHSGVQDDQSGSSSKAKPLTVTNGKPMTILYGSNSGTCEGLSQSLASAGNAHGFSATVKPLDAAVDQFPTDQPVVIITASYEGNPPDNAGLFVQWLKGTDASKIKAAKIAVFGCGHSDWAATYQKVPKLIESELLQKGASTVLPRGETNVAAGKIFDDFDAWSDNLWPALGSKSTGDEFEGLDMELSTNSRSSHLRQFVQDAIVVKNERLTPDGVPEKRQVEVKLPTNMTYEAGDYLAVLPINNVHTIGRVLKRFALPWDTMMKLKKGAHTTIPTETELSVTAVLGAYVELKSPATKRNLTTLAKYAGEEKISTMNEKVSLLDILEKHPSIQLPFPVYLSMLPPMRIRQYSIASSALADPTVASITFSVVNENTADQPHLGVATTYLREVRPGSTIQLAVKKSHASFHLPLDDATPVIMIGAGTGIAPFRGFIQERATKIQAGKKLGPALLFIGCRHPNQDRLHADELTQWERDGAVRVFNAYSRAPELSEGCKYAQDRVWHERELVGDLFNQGARVYICGSNSLGKGLADTAAKMAVERAQRKGETRTVEEGLKWWESLRNERYAVDVFD